MQGVSIVLMVKKRNAKGCKVYHRDLFGLREDKYEWLAKKEFKKRDYEMLKPDTPWYFLIKRDTEEIEHYNKWWKVNDIFSVNSVGIVTARDEFAIAFSKKCLESRISQFRNLNFTSDFLESSYNLKNSGSWNMSMERKGLSEDEEYDKYYNEILYRPFDIRYVYYSDHIIERMRYEVMQHMLKDNIALTIGRQGQVVGNESLWNLAFVSENIIDLNLFYRGGELLFPLYLYPTEEKKKSSFGNMMLFEPQGKYGKERRANISEKLMLQLHKAYKKNPPPEEILYYVYAVLYSNIYREKYAEFLKIDFPRIPFTKKYELFKELAEFGKELTELHLLKHKSLAHPSVRFWGKKGSDKIEKPHYDEKEKFVYINEDKYFENISPEMWNYQIGGYRVLEKYLKDRKGRQMEDPGHYCRTAEAISKTIELQKELDKYFKKAEKDVIEG